MSHVCLFKEEKNQDPYRSTFVSEGHTVTFNPVLQFEYTSPDLIVSALLKPYTGLIITSSRALQAITQAIHNLDQVTSDKIIQLWQNNYLFMLEGSREANLPLQFKEVF